MAVSRADRRADRLPRVRAWFEDTEVPAVLDLLELTELAWHDCYGDITPSETIIDDMLSVAHGDLAKLVRSAHLAVTDWRDLRMAAEGMPRA